MEPLEKVVKEKVEPLVGNTLKKFLGVTVTELGKDITDKISSDPLLGYAVHTELQLHTAKQLFKKEFLTKVIQVNSGNISETAKVVGLDRRSLHRDIQSLSIDLLKLRTSFYGERYFKQEAMDAAIKSALDAYRDVLHPKRLRDMYQEVPHLTGELADLLPSQTLSWKQAEELFEQRYFKKLLKEVHTLKEVAKRAGVAYETLVRKRRKLGF